MILEIDVKVKKICKDYQEEVIKKLKCIRNNIVKERLNEEEYTTINELSFLIYQFEEANKKTTEQLQIKEEELKLEKQKEEK